MKKVISVSGMGMVAMSLLLGSCVSQRKYAEAQSTIEQYRTDSAAWAARYNTMQQNVSSLEEKNKQLQTEYDKTRTTYMNEQKRWNAYQSYFDESKSTSEQIHQQLHSVLSNSGIPDNNIYSAGRRVYVTVPETAFFAAGSSKLTTKGREALSKIASVLKNNPDLEIDVVANFGQGFDDNDQRNTSGNWDADDPKGERTNVTSDARANVGDSGYVGSGTVTKSNTAKDKKKGTVSSNKTRTEQNDRDMNFRVSGNAKTSGTKKSKSENWTLHTARVNAIVSELSNQGVASVHMVAPSGNRMVSNTYNNTEDNNMSKTADKTASGSMAKGGRGYQIVISPNTDKWYDMMSEGNRGTGAGTGTSGLGTGSGSQR